LLTQAGRCSNCGLKPKLLQILNIASMSCCCRPVACLVFLLPVVCRKDSTRSPCGQAA
jgi:hypothetical protein